MSQDTRPEYAEGAREALREAYAAYRRWRLDADEESFLEWAEDQLLRGSYE